MHSAHTWGYYASGGPVAGETDYIAGTPQANLPTGVVAIGAPVGCLSVTISDILCNDPEMIRRRGMNFVSMGFFSTVARIGLLPGRCHCKVVR